MRCLARKCDADATVAVMCDRHWRMLPKALRDHFLGAYRRDPMGEGCIRASINAIEFISHEEMPDAGLEWRAVVGYEGRFEVSEFGQVRETLTTRRRRWEVNSSNYPQIRLESGGRFYRIHDLVARAFLGPCPAGYEVNHEDGNKMRPHAKTMSYATKSENFKHAKLTGLRDRRRRLTDDERRAIAQSSGTIREVAGEYDVEPTTIRNIRKKGR